MDHPFGQLNPEQGPAGTDPLPAQHPSGAIEQQQPHLPLQQQEAFETGTGWLATVPVGPHVGARLQHIQETLHPIGGDVEVVVAAPARGGGGP
jgi:hypothetical protein